VDKKKLTYFNVGFGVLLMVLVLLLAHGSVRESGNIVLPEMPADSSGTGENSGESGMNVISITPETVRPAITTLSRPVAYQRQQTVETFWSGGSGKSVSQVAVSGSFTRVDTTLADGSVCHMLITGDTAAVWYDEETKWTVLSASRYTADIAQRMLTYETVRDLPVASIAEADYREMDGINCIYVATREDESGYADRFWVSVESGLLLAAERTLEGEPVYRFTTTEPEVDTPDGGLFLLPDGSALTP